MSKKLRLQRGEIATIITIVSLIVLGASTLVSSVFLSKNKQTTSTKAAASTRLCCRSYQCKQYGCKDVQRYWNAFYVSTSKTCASASLIDCPSGAKQGGFCVADSACSGTAATVVPTTIVNTLAPTSAVRPCSYWISAAACNNFPDTCEWKSVGYGYGMSCQSKVQPTTVNTPTPTRAPGNELSGYEDCLRCCVRDTKCDIPGSPCKKGSTRIRWYSYNCTKGSSCSSFNKTGGYPSTVFENCPSDVGRENPTKCVPGGCTETYSGLSVPTTDVVEPTTVIPTSSRPSTDWCTETGKRDRYGGECWYCYYKGATPVSSSGCGPTVSPTSGRQTPTSTSTTSGGQTPTPIPSKKNIPTVPIIYSLDFSQTIHEDCVDTKIPNYSSLNGAMTVDTESKLKACEDKGKRIFADDWAVLCCK